VLKLRKMTKFEFGTEEFLKELDRMGIVYTIDSNPSPEKIERIKKSIEKRDERLKQMREDYLSGKFKDVIDSL
jgi:CO dehydrogenase/acetyl-CoA synthase beta subunit